MKSIISYWKWNSVRIFITTLRIFVVLLVLCIFFIIYKLFTLLIPSVLALLILSFFLLKLTTFTCTILTFPGCIWAWKRNTENHFRKAFVDKIKRRVASLRGLVEYILENRLWHHFLSEEELMHIRRVITSVMNLYTKQTVHQTLTSKQKEMMNLFSELETVLFEIQVVNKASDMKFTFWKMLQGDRTIFEDLAKQNSALYFEDKDKGNALLARCKNIEKHLNDIVRPLSIFARFKRWLDNDTFGTLDQLREELDNRYHCKRIALNVEKKVTLDCVFISKKVAEEAAVFSEGAEIDKKTEHHTHHTTTHGDHTKDIFQSFTMRAKHASSAIIICCPNAGYYECMHYENEWIEFYVRNGVNVFLWNYRGYGKSTGKPSPDALRRDGEAIVDYLRQQLKMKKIGVHGESIGGLVATHIAKAKKLDFLCTDRTFMNLSAVGTLSFGKFIGYLYKMITLWDHTISTTYIQTNCYKVMTFDPKDEVIHALGSLTYGVTRKVLEGKLGIRNEPVRPSINKKFKFCSLKALLAPFKRFCFAFRFLLYERKVSAQIDDYYNILSKEQSLALFWALKRISELFTDLSNSHGLSTLNKQTRIFKPMNPRVNTKNSKMPKPCDENNGDEPPDSENPGRDDTTPNYAIQFGSKDKIEKDLGDNERAVSHAIELKGLCRQDNGFLMKSTEKKSYLEQFKEESKTSDDVVCLLIRAFPIFEDLEAGGIHISDINSAKSEHQYDLFKFYIYCFEIWGSYLPLFKTVEDEIQDISSYQQHAIDKLREFLLKLEHIIKKSRRKEEETQSTTLFSEVLDDLDLIFSILSSMYYKIPRPSCKSPSSFASKLINDLEAGQDELTLGNPMPSDKTENKLELIINKNGVTEPIDLVNSQSLGYLLPLSCGHNGMLRAHELEIYEYHLRNSKLV